MNILWDNQKQVTNNNIYKEIIQKTMQHIKIFKAYYTTTKTHHNTLLVCNVEITLSTLYTLDECVWQCYGSKTTTL
jgi:hypothetical protein